METPKPRPLVALENLRWAVAGGRTAADGCRRARTRGRLQTGGGARGRRAGGRGRRCANDARAATDGGARTGTARRARIGAYSRGRGRDGRGRIHRDGGWTPLRTGQPYPRRADTLLMRMRADEGGFARRRWTGGDGSMMGRGCCSPSGSMTPADAIGVAGGSGVRDVGGAPGATGGAAGDGGNGVRGARVDEDEPVRGAA